MSWPKDIFDAAVSRAEVFVRFYKLLHSARSHTLDGDDLIDVNTALGWPENANVLMLGGSKRKAPFYCDMHQLRPRNTFYMIQPRMCSALRT